MEETPFWERPETVEKFAGRDPDHRLRAVVDDYADPGATRVLDLGCAGGRNAVFLAERGFDLTALDASGAMVAETRARVATVLGVPEALRRVRRGVMTDLSFLPDDSQALVVALGVFHMSASRAEWRAALAETARVTSRGGRVLVASFTDETNPDGTGLVPVPGEPGVFERSMGRNVLVSAPELDAAMARVGLVPAAPTEVVRRETEKGYRVTANALYRRVD